MTGWSVMQDENPPLWAEIDLAALGHNCLEVKKCLEPQTRFMAVVKADGYAHGAVQVARTALDHGADRLGVARLHEAIALRKAGLSVPILIFGHTSPDSVQALAEHGLTQTVYDTDYARALSRAAGALGVSLDVHLKIDTGMGRLGLVAVPEPGSGADFRPQVVEEAKAAASLEHLFFEGVFTHFAQADSRDKSHALGQLACFRHVLDALQAEGLEFPVRHAANSGAVIDLPQAHLDMVRPGLMLYGLYPSPEVDMSRVNLKPVLSLKSRIAQCKNVASGFKISYGSTFATQSATTIATIPVGYADGFARVLSSRGEMLVRGRRAPIAGRVCMDQTMLDVGHIDGVRSGDEVVIYGQQGQESLPVDEVADLCWTISYETVATVMARVPRIYL
jgi:alanine racemase